MTRDPILICWLKPGEMFLAKFVSIPNKVIDKILQYSIVLTVCLFGITLLALGVSLLSGIHILIQLQMLVGPSSYSANDRVVAALGQVG